MDIGAGPRESLAWRSRRGPSRINFMRRISAIFIAVCMVLIAGSLGAVLYLGLKLDARTSAIVALAALTGMALYNTVSNRLRDRGDLGDQIADLSRGTADLARQVAEICAPAQRHGKPRRSDREPRARRDRSDRRRDRRTGRAGPADRRHRRRRMRPPCSEQGALPARPPTRHRRGHARACRWRR